MMNNQFATQVATTLKGNEDMNNQIATQVETTLKGNEDIFARITAIRKVLNLNESGVSLSNHDAETIVDILDILEQRNGMQSAMMKFNYTSHDQIDFGMQQYIKNVACVNNINELTLEEINDYLNEMDWWYGDE